VIYISVAKKLSCMHPQHISKCSSSERFNRISFHPCC
jgi:hypothetical protein